MTGAWEDPILVASLCESVTLAQAGSGQNTIVSGAESGESVHVYRVEIYNETPNSGFSAVLQEVDGSGTAITLYRAAFTPTSSVTAPVKDVIGGDDPLKPFRTLNDDALMRIQASGQSGSMTVIAHFWRDKA